MEREIEIRILNELTQKQTQIVKELEKNFYVTACPGSGKTRTLTRKIAYLSNSFPNSLKKIIAITYTNRAANEIVERLENLKTNQEHVWVGTIHQFCLDFILRPFGLNMRRLSRGIKIIDEYVVEKYLLESAEKIGWDNYDRWNDSPNLRRNTNGGFYEKNLQRLKLAKEYHKKIREKNEIDFDLILTLALKILEDKPIVTNIISRNIRSILVDEFQDTNDFQYEIIGKLTQAKKSITCLFVGDSDQAIFTSLNGTVKTLSQLEEITELHFNPITLDGCFRSTQQIIDFYSNFQQVPYHIESHSELKNVLGDLVYRTDVNRRNLPRNIANIIQDFLEKGVPESEICVVAPQYHILYSLTTDLKEILPEVNFRSQDIYPIKPDEFNIFFKISFLIFTTPGVKIRLRRKIAKEIILSLKEDYGIRLDSDFTSLDFLDILNATKSDSLFGLKFFEERTRMLFSNLDIVNENINLDFSNFLSKCFERMNRHQLADDIESFKNVYKTKKGVNISTIHKVKGEEYEVVIGFGLLEGFIPNWSDIINRPTQHSISEAKKSIYVLASRSKKHLFLFSELGRVTRGGNAYHPTQAMLLSPSTSAVNRNINLT